MLTVQEVKEKIEELLDYESELTDSQLSFLTKISDYTAFTEEITSKVEKLHDKVFGDNVQDTFEVWES